jgi:hypothetical protein
MAWIWLATCVGHGFEYQSDSDKKSLEMARQKGFQMRLLKNHMSQSLNKSYRTTYNRH